MALEQPPPCPPPGQSTPHPTSLCPKDQNWPSPVKAFVSIPHGADRVQREFHVRLDLVLAKSLPTTEDMTEAGSGRPENDFGGKGWFIIIF